MFFIQCLICVCIGLLTGKSVINKDWFSTTISVITGLLYCISISVR